MKECDDSCAVITCDVLPVIINIFKLSKYNQKSREKCLIIISLLLNKLSYADGNDPDLLAPLSFLRQREVVHYQRFKELFDEYVEKGLQ